MDRFNVEAYRLNSEISARHTIHRADRVEQWRRIKPIGTGGFATVYLERDRVGRLRAVKELSKQFNEAQQQDYLRELFAMAFSSKNQSCFPHFQGWYEDGSKIYIAMEYFELGDLSKCVAGPLSETESRKIAFQITEALAVLHSQNITHRDLKPENVFVFRTGPDWLVKLGDFGISKRVQDDGTSLHTRYIGRYVAPEVLGLADLEDESEWCYTNAVDIWSLGCLVYWLLHGDPPFKDNRDLARYCQGKIALPTQELEGRLSDDGLRFLQSCLSVSSRDRLAAEQALAQAWLSTAFDASEEESARHSGQSLEIARSLQPGPDSSSSSSALTQQRDKDPFLEDTVIVHSKEDSREISTIQTRDRSDIREIESTNHVALNSASEQARISGGSQDLDSNSRSNSSMDQRQTQSGSPPAFQRKALGEVEKAAALDVLRSNNKTIKSANLLHWAIANGYPDVVRLVLDREDSYKLIDAVYSDCTPLIHALVMDQTHTVKLLLAAGANVEKATAAHHKPLLVAASRGLEESLSLLLDAGANIEARGHGGRTALALVIESFHVGCERILLERGADINTKDDNSRTPLMRQARAGDRLGLIHLLDAGANVHETSRLAGTALTSAARRGHTACLHLLVDRGADINVAALNGRTPLHEAVWREDSHTIRALVKAGADLERRILPANLKTAFLAQPDLEQHTPLIVAAYNGHVDTARLLVDLGALLTAKTSTGLTAVDVARQQGHVHVYKFLLSCGGIASKVTPGGLAGKLKFAFM